MGALFTCTTVDSALVQQIWPSRKPTDTHTEKFRGSTKCFQEKVQQVKLKCKISFSNLQKKRANKKCQRQDLEQVVQHVHLVG